MKALTSEEAKTLMKEMGYKVRYNKWPQNDPSYIYYNGEKFIFCNEFGKESLSVLNNEYASTISATFTVIPMSIIKHGMTVVHRNGAKSFVSTYNMLIPSDIIPSIPLCTIDNITLKCLWSNSSKWDILEIWDKSKLLWLSPEKEVVSTERKREDIHMGMALKCKELELWQTPTWLTNLALYDSKGNLRPKGEVKHIYLAWVKSHTQRMFQSQKEAEECYANVNAHVQELQATKTTMFYAY